MSFFRNGRRLSCPPKSPDLMPVCNVLDKTAFNVWHFGSRFGSRYHNIPSGLVESMPQKVKAVLKNYAGGFN